MPALLCVMHVGPPATPGFPALRQFRRYDQGGGRDGDDTPQVR